MMKLPIKPKFSPSVAEREIEKARSLAGQLMVEIPELDFCHDEFREFMIRGEIESSPTLHLDDFSEIPVIGKTDNSRVLQQRARLRACDGDWVAQSRQVERGYSDYCEYQLGLGRIKWLYPAIAESDTRQIAVECWQDRRLRHDLEQAIRHQGLRYIHPHISTKNVWELAALLHRSTRMPLQVIGPTPALANWANDKIEFTAVVERLLGQAFVPHTETAYNFAALAQSVTRLAQTHQKLAIKFPYGTGGNGNFLVDAAEIRGRSLKQVRNDLKGILQNAQWPKRGRVLVDVWEADVINSPSLQTWIPATGDPVIEGLFVQAIEGETGRFVGSCPANLPPSLEQQIVNQGFLLATLFQSLGYIGRCSFDLILVGQSVTDCRVEFIECNARWGGTSGPMTLMNRLATDDQHTYCIRQLPIPAIKQMEFAELRREIEDDLYQPTTGKGDLVLFNPARIKKQSSIELVALAASDAELKTRLADATKTIERVALKHAGLDRARIPLPHVGFDKRGAITD